MANHAVFIGLESSTAVKAALGQHLASPHIDDYPRTVWSTASHRLTMGFDLPA